MKTENNYEKRCTKMSEIIVAGAGHGGLVAAWKLAQLGHKVTVYERYARENLGYDQKDPVDSAYFDYAGITYPEEWHAPNNVITLVPIDETVAPVTLPEEKSASTLIVERRELLAFLIDLCEKAGVHFAFGCEVREPVVLGSRIIGIMTSQGIRLADLIIDACGIDSPVRRNLPDFTHVQKELGRFDRLNVYRAYYNRIEGKPDPEHRYYVYVNANGTVGFTWLITEPDSADILIARFGEVTEADIKENLDFVCEKNEHVGRELVRGGKVVDIPVRQPLAVFIADGYAAVGDSACMTIPLKGSGIGYSIKAGSILARAVEADRDGLFNCDTLWKYEREFFHEIGFAACTIALEKNLLPYLTAKDVSDFIASGILTAEELAELNTDKIEYLRKNKIVSTVKNKLKLLNEMPELRNKGLKIVGWFGRVKLVEPLFPTKYDRDDVEKWAEHYNEFFESIKTDRIPGDDNE